MLAWDGKEVEGACAVTLFVVQGYGDPVEDPHKQTYSMCVFAWAFAHMHMNVFLHVDVWTHGHFCQKRIVLIDSPCAKVKRPDSRGRTHTHTQEMSLSSERETNTHIATWFTLIWASALGHLRGQWFPPVVWIMIVSKQNKMFAILWLYWIEVSYWIAGQNKFPVYLSKLLPFWLTVYYLNQCVLPVAVRHSIAKEMLSTPVPTPTWSIKTICPSTLEDKITNPKSHCSSITCP